MNRPVIDQKFGRQAFGGDPAGYHAARPTYPDWVFETLVAHDCFAMGNATFEIGPGTGIATRKLFDIGANPVTAIEPDIRLAAFLQNSIGRKELS
ncbi:MAG TPA: rRNA adenine N-6-methyltransferase family protein, partial [Mucilaginibacter sp.]|nr:rRNA adenine N-6-methyltransferase family protein [Mucilaginibacter sp.]